jgi:hypothetical protein
MNEALVASAPPTTPPFTAKEGRAVVKSLQGTYPTIYPVVLRFTSEGWDSILDWGETRLAKRKGKKVFLISINSTLCHAGQFMVLVHEYAHALAWPATDKQADAEKFHHSPEWGIAEARLWALVGDEKPQGRAF